MTKPGTATIEVRGLLDAMARFDELAWTAFRHAAYAAEGLRAHPCLARCAGCGEPWTEDLGPLALVEAVVGDARALGLLCEACARHEDAPALLERILRAMLPEDAQVVDQHAMHGPAGHA